MSHEISISKRTGKAEAIFAINPAWHNLGTVTDRLLTPNEAYLGAGLDWRVNVVPAYILLPDGSYKQISGRAAVVRDDSNEVMGIPTPQYQDYQNEEQKQEIEDIFGNIECVTAACAIYGGRRVIFTVELGATGLKVGGIEDGFKQYMVFSTGHDGESGKHVLPTNVRVVCQNTFSMALSESSKFGIEIRHSRKMKDRIAETKAALVEAAKAGEVTLDKFRLLGQKEITDSKRNEVFNAVRDILLPPEILTEDQMLVDSLVKAHQESLRERRRQDLLDALGTNFMWEVTNNNLPEGSAYTVYQACSDTIEHPDSYISTPYRGSPLERMENEMNSRLFGKARKNNVKVLDMVMDMVA